MGYTMQMFFDAVDPVVVTVIVFWDTPAVAEQVFAVLFDKYFVPVFCAEEDLIEDLGVGGSWGGLLFNPFRVDVSGEVFSP